jgi:hypothetical protein
MHTCNRHVTVDGVIGHNSVWKYLHSTRPTSSMSTKEICWKTRRCAYDRHTSRRRLVALQRVAARLHAVRTSHFQYNSMSNYSLPYYNTRLLRDYLVRLCLSTFPKHAVEHRFKPHTTCYYHAPGVILRVVPISDVLPLLHETVGRTHARRRFEMTCRCSGGAREDHFIEPRLLVIRKVVMSVYLSSHVLKQLEHEVYMSQQTSHNLRPALLDWSPIPTYGTRLQRRTTDDPSLPPGTTSEYFLKTFSVLPMACTASLVPSGMYWTEHCSVPRAGLL